MIGIDDILRIDSETAFEQAALEIFAFQARTCQPYREYIDALGINPNLVDRIDKIPFLPIGLFKSHRIYCGPDEPEQIFTSSSTSGMVPARHYVASLSLYEKTFRKAFGLFYGQIPVFALLPSYLEREGSSLVYMADALIRANGGDFYLHDTDKLISDMQRTNGPKILLGVTYALLDLTETSAPKLSDTIVMETGGMKGRREELPKEEMHRILCRGFGVERIHSEYGMAELMSQAYSDGEGVFVCPPWMRVIIRDPNDPFDFAPSGTRGGINVIDLANIYSCAFIQTQDLGQRLTDQNSPAEFGHTENIPGQYDKILLKNNTTHHRLPGSQRFRMLGRLDGSEIRGCNLLVQ